MGIYLFDTDVLIDLMENTTYDDFGGEVIPHAIHTHPVYGFDFDGYWEDIGTIRSFYETNLALTQPDTPFEFHDPDRPIYTRARYLPPSVVNGGALNNVFLADGCVIERAQIYNSVIGLRSRIEAGTQIHNSVVMGADYYESPPEEVDSELPIGIGPDCHIEGAIIDKNVHMGAGVEIRPFPPDTELDTDSYVVKDGIVVIPKNTVLQPGTFIGPES
jgi:glucose-1-phosphate adenylyltransferase